LNFNENIGISEINNIETSVDSNKTELIDFERRKSIEMINITEKLNKSNIIIFD
jgi:hypothetical protein